MGYTATPFANIFVNPEAATDRHGDDIFPRSFIINVKPPSNYVGPSRVFGLNADPDTGIPAESGLPIVRTVDDYAAPTSFPPGHKKDLISLRATRLSEARHPLFHPFVRGTSRSGSTRETQLDAGPRHAVHRRSGEGCWPLADEVMPLQRRLQFGDGDRLPSLPLTSFGNSGATSSSRRLPPWQKTPAYHSRGTRWRPNFMPRPRRSSS